MKGALTLGLSTIVLVSPVHATSNITQDVQRVQPSVVEWRRHIHENPELPYQEIKTSAYVADLLKKMPGMEVQTGLAKTGIKAILRGGLPGPVIALRADMDALPVEEKNDLPFRSRATGTVDGKSVHVMHACGHDTHTAMLLGAAQVLSSHRDQIKGTIVFLFQPAEEGGGGAFAMIKDGALENPKVEAIFGQHISAGYPSGTIDYRTEGTMASADIFSVNVKGKAGHGSAPWAARDPILAGSQMVVNLQAAIARDVDMQQGGSTLTVGKIDGGTRANVIPEEAHFSGTIRTLSAKNRDILQESLQRIIQATAQAHGVQAELDYKRLYPVTRNNSALVAQSLPALTKASNSQIREIAAKMSSEDFGAYAEKIPAFFWFLNASPYPDKAGAPNHSPQFSIDESAMEVGVRAIVETALNYAGSKRE